MRKLPKSVETLTHGEASRRNIPMVVSRPAMPEEGKAPFRVTCERRNTDPGPQLVWRGKEDAWATLNSDTSCPFPRPASGRIAVKVINHLGDEAMTVFRI